MGHRGFACLRLHVFCILLRADLVIAEKIAQRDRVRQIKAHAGCRRRGRRYAGQSNVFGFDSAFYGKHRVDRVLHHELGHDLPSLHGGRVRVMRAVDLKLAAVGDDRLAFAGVHKASEHVDVSVKHVVLGILMDARHPFFHKHHGDVGTCHP